MSKFKSLWWSLGLLASFVVWTRLVCVVAVGAMIHRRLVVTMRFAEHLVRVFVNRGIQAAVRAHTGVVPMRMARRCRTFVDMGRVMPVAMVPRGRTPIRHKAQRRERGYGEDGGTRGGVAIHGAAVVVAVNRETVGIVACVCPGYGRTITIRGVRERTIPIGWYHTGSQQERGSCQCGDGYMHDFHNAYVAVVLVVDCERKTALGTSEPAHVLRLIKK